VGKGLQRGLGKGIESLIPTQLVEDRYDPTSNNEQRIAEIDINFIEVNPHQPRKKFDEAALNALVLSIKTHGLLQPVVVTKIDNMYRLIAGERRLRAFKELGKAKIPAIIRSAEEQAQMELALIENLQREDLNILEVATALLKLSDQFSLNEKEVGERVGRSASSVHNIVRLLSLPSDAKQALAEGKITEGHARQIMALDGQSDKQKQLLEYMLKYDWSVRKAENFVKKFKEGDATVDQALQRVQATNDQTVKLAQRLNTPVHLRHMAKKNQLVIEYQTDEDLERIISTLTS